MQLNDAEGRAESLRNLSRLCVDLVSMVSARVDHIERCIVEWGGSQGRDLETCAVRTLELLL